MTDPVTVAVDANGADLGPAEVARGAAAAAAERGVRVLLFGPAARVRRPAGRRRDRRRAGLDRQGRRSRPRGPREPRRVDRPGRPGRRRRPRRRARLRRLDRRRARRRAVPLQARPRRPPARARARRARARRAVPAARRRRQRRGPARAPRPVRAHGRRVHGGRDGRASGRAWRCSPTARSPARAPRTSSPPTRLLTGTRPGLNFVGNVEGFAIGTGVADVIVTDGFTGNVDAEGDGGDRRRRCWARSAARRCPRRAVKARRAAAAPGAARAARRDRPAGRQGGAVLLGLRQLGVVPHGSFGAPRVRERDRASPPAACATTASAARTSAWPPRARCGAPAGAVRGGRYACPTSHDSRRGLRS